MSEQHPEAFLSTRHLLRAAAAEALVDGDEVFIDVRPDLWAGLTQSDPAARLTHVDTDLFVLRLYTKTKILKVEIRAKTIAGLFEVRRGKAGTPRPFSGTLKKEIEDGL